VELNDYQSQASKTDQRPDASEQAMLIPMLGIAGEIGTLLAEYKRQIRDGEANVLFREHVREELGDILWYAANLATKIGWQLEDIATYNLDKTRDRWNALGTSPHYFDETYPTNERLPRRFDVLFAYDDVNGQKKLVVTDDLGQPVGNPLSDNAYEGDGYRFHDAYHFTFAALLGWSPVARRNFKRKRKSDPVVDEVEDGGRGWVIEEGIAALSFAYASEHDYFSTTAYVDEALLRTVRTLTATVEARVRSGHEWANAIVTGSRMWRLLKEHDGGRLKGDLEKRTIEYVEPGSR
jgi:NTP pyrophosphatase (non-canonical NTP hydrolase)